MAPRYRVTLTVEERSELKALTRAATKTTGNRHIAARTASVHSTRMSYSPVVQREREEHLPPERVLSSGNHSQKKLSNKMGN